MSNMEKIPRIIHYCWFGKSEKPKIVKKCIESWKRTLVGYEIIEWNESNFDLNSNEFIKEAYLQKKFAFVSDYVRLFVLYNIGGIYLDTDVEVLQPLDRFLNERSFWGFEQNDYVATSTFGAQKGNELIKEFLDFYEDRTFINSDGSSNTQTNVEIITKILERKGLKLNNQFQELENIGAVYPQMYFSPFDYINYRHKITRESYTIHHFYKSWLSPKEKLKSNIKRVLIKIVGANRVSYISNLIRRRVK